VLDLGRRLTREVERTFEERTVGRRESIGRLGFLPFRERCLGVEVRADVSATPLDEVPRELLTMPAVAVAAQVLGQPASSGSSRVRSERNACSLPLCGVAVTSTR